MDKLNPALERAKELYDLFERHAHREDFSEAPMSFEEMWELEDQSLYNSTIGCCEVHIDELVKLINDPDLISFYGKVKDELKNIPLL